ncbi:hypothetical protein SLEP1_g5296 [Rubroshorea leprosula]|uniref:Uncharacterized protein n=1 Tax=Rubroshorea leprosula TaxID=152421 RepID=A0AAV5I1B3_9ROSI|nr:hypothetical protein SLEP1_g5296 [Rubroshorea leprosula]
MTAQTQEEILAAHLEQQKIDVGLPPLCCSELHFQAPETFLGGTCLDYA